MSGYDAWLEGPITDGRHELAWEDWYERGGAEEDYEAAIEDGTVPCERYTTDGVGINPQPFEDWAQGPAGDAAFELWLWCEEQI